MAKATLGGQEIEIDEDDFIQEPANGACKIARLPKPTGCV